MANDKNGGFVGVVGYGGKKFGTYEDEFLFICVYEVRIVK